MLHAIHCWVLMHEQVEQLRSENDAQRRALTQRRSALIRRRDGLKARTSELDPALREAKSKLKSETHSTLQTLEQKIRTQVLYLRSF